MPSSWVQKGSPSGHETYPTCGIADVSKNEIADKSSFCHWLNLEGGVFPEVPGLKHSPGDANDRGKFLAFDGENQNRHLIKIDRSYCPACMPF